MDNKTKEALKQLQAEIRSVQGTLELMRTPGAVPAESGPEAIDSTKRPSGKVDAKSLTDLLTPVDETTVDKSDAAIGYAVAFRGSGQKSVKKIAPASLTLARLATISDEQVAVIANALSAAPKVAILRALISLPGGTESASNLGESTGLSSGSLYYHLRDLSYAGLIVLATRGQYTITSRGIAALLLINALAVEG